MEIRKFNDPILRKRAKKVWKIDAQIKSVAEDMAKIMKESEGIGLAGPQVGLSLRIITVETDYSTGEIKTLINPKIIKKSSKKIVGTEGCLSFPGIFLDLKRSEQVTVKAKDISGKKVIFTAEGMLARALQHEIDHLNGVVFLDRLGLFKKIRFKLEHPSLKI